jgi:hypothetical protein
MNANTEVIAGETTDLEQALRQVKRALSGLKFGTISIIVQDGVVVQVERTEKFRLRRGAGQ